MSKSGGNAAFGAAVLKRVGAQAEKREAGQSGASPNPASSILDHRENALSAMATGKMVPDTTLLVDPSRCRIWEHHNRDAAWLNEETCADLIESIKAEGRQRIPAIVRRVKSDPEYDYEVIAGRRRHWSVSWLRAHNYEAIDFLITVQNLSDQEAFRVADLENRSRKDISDIERARDYEFGLGAFYDGRQDFMAERLGVSRSWLSRFLVLARLDPIILSAFASPYEIGVSHAAQLAPLVRKEETRFLVEAEAKKLAADQIEARSTGLPPIAPMDVVRRLAASTVSKKAVVQATDRSEPMSFQSAKGLPMLVVTPGRGGSLMIKVAANSGASRKELLRAFAKALDLI
jgi:ParB family chromosome partitioning protein